MFKKGANSPFEQHVVRVSPRSYSSPVTKQCKKCGAIKPLIDYYEARGTRDGHRGACKACESAARAEWYQRNREHVIEKVRSWQTDNRDRYLAWQREYKRGRPREEREGHLRRTFGLSLDDYDAILAAQGGGCAICGERPISGQSLHIDHLGDVVRGILCVRCNNALGLLKEDPELIGVACDYVDSGGFASAGVYTERGLAIGRARGLVKGSG